MALFTMELIDEPWPFGSNTPRPCPICGLVWRPHAFSFLPCHAACLWTDEGARLAFDTDLTVAAMARNLGVTSSIIKAGVEKGRRLKA